MEENLLLKLINETKLEQDFFEKYESSDKTTLHIEENSFPSVEKETYKSTTYGYGFFKSMDEKKDFLPTIMEKPNSKVMEENPEIKSEMMEQNPEIRTVQTEQRPIQKDLSEETNHRRVNCFREGDNRQGRRVSFILGNQ